MADESPSLPNTETFHVYTLQHNRNNGGVYVGQTCQLPENRAYHHFWELDRGKHWSQRLQRAYKKYGKEEFSFEVVESYATHEECDEGEKFFIDYFRFLGANVYNSREGGHKNFRLSDEHRAKLSAKSKGRFKGAKLPAWQIEKARLARMEAEKLRTPEQKVAQVAKWRVTMTNPDGTWKHKRSEEAKAKVSVSLKGRPLHPNSLKALHQHRFNPKLMSEETRLKMRMAKLGRKLPRWQVEKQMESAKRNKEKLCPTS